MESNQFKQIDFGCQTDFLFSSPSFMSGMGTAINLFGNFYHFNKSKDEGTADITAITCDFKIVAGDMRNAIRLVSEDMEQ